MDNSLRQCERDVEAARAKLADDLAVLRSPATVASFTESLKDTALNAKDAVIEQAKDAVRSKVSSFVDELKAKAAANPAAALTIGAGIAWHVVRHPPIATALIGAGLYSLWRSQAVPSNTDYFEHGKERLKEQASELGASAMDLASEMGDAVVAKAGELTDTAKQTVQGWSQSAADSAVNASDAVKAGIEVGGRSRATRGARCQGRDGHRRAHGARTHRPGRTGNGGGGTACLRRSKICRLARDGRRR